MGLLMYFKHTMPTNTYLTCLNCPVLNNELLKEQINITPSIDIDNTNIWKTEAGKSGILGQPQLHSKFKISLSYMRPLGNLQIIHYACSEDSQDNVDCCYHP